ncbi:MAG TPA: low molecular weight phosphatase family protein [Caulobacteraceae bacterium]|nr:low molecular weight phosphatase family protein [Caulobacteraceae bacterium]
MSAEDPSAVLFVCTFNRVRSPMAAALARLAGVCAHSCGLAAGEEVDPLAAAVMAEVGADLSDHAPAGLEQMLEGRRFLHIVALSGEAWSRLQLMPELGAAHWPIPDPTLGEGSREARLEAYRLTRQALQKQISERLFPALRGP